MIVSKIIRRNSEITIYKKDNKILFKKKYFSEFEIIDEINTYKKIDKILDKNFFLPKIVSFDKLNNFIVLNYISGNNFYEEYKLNGNKIFNFNFYKILNLFYLFDRNLFKIDTDPTNLILESSSKKIFIVDPISSNLDICHYSFIVYFIGMLKCYVAYPKRYFNFQFFILWKKTYSYYLKISKEDNILLKNGLNKYLNNIIKWNIKYSRGERLYKRIFRILFFVPFWFLVKVSIKILF